MLLAREETRDAGVLSDASQVSVLGFAIDQATYLVLHLAAFFFCGWACW